MYLLLSCKSGCLQKNQIRKQTFLLTFWASVDSNETLYGGDPKFLSEINKLCETLIGQILDHLKGLGRDEV